MAKRWSVRGFAFAAFLVVLAPTVYLGASRLNGVSTRSSRTATVGTKAPPIELAQADGSIWKLDEARKSSPVVLVFLRGFF